MMHRPFSLPEVVALILAVALAAGCQSPPSPTTLLLLKKAPDSSDVYRAPCEDDVPYATNVVYVPRDARFSMSLEALNPGWLHEHRARQQKPHIHPAGSR